MHEGILILDVGGVIIKSPWELLQESYPDVKNTYPDLLGPLVDINNSEYQKLISGSLSEPDYWINFSSKLQKSFSDFECSKNPIRELILKSKFPIRNELIKLLGFFVLRGGKVITFSNGLYKNLGADWWSKNGPMNLISKHLDASETGMFKPNSLAFRLLLEEIKEYSSNAVLYLDDNPVYVDVAQSIGMQSNIFSITNQQYNLDMITNFFGI